MSNNLIFGDRKRIREGQKDESSANLRQITKPLGKKRGDSPDFWVKFGVSVRLSCLRAFRQEKKKEPASVGSFLYCFFEV